MQWCTCYLNNVFQALGKIAWVFSVVYLAEILERDNHLKIRKNNIYTWLLHYFHTSSINLKTNPVKTCLLCIMFVLCISRYSYYIEKNLYLLPSLLNRLLHENCKIFLSSIFCNLMLARNSEKIFSFSEIRQLAWFLSNDALIIFSDIDTTLHGISF